MLHLNQEKQEHRNNMQLLYAGIGSRNTPSDILLIMQQLAETLAKNGFTLRSGAADGADYAFEIGCDKVNGKKEIWLPWKNFNNHSDTKLYPTENHFTLAETIHPAWNRLKLGAKKLHARNVGQILGKDVNTPVSFVICWTPDGCETHNTRTRITGGTGSAISLANHYNIPIFNLQKQESYSQLLQIIK
jgi:hypothetical protein